MYVLKWSVVRVAQNMLYSFINVSQFMRVIYEQFVHSLFDSFGIDAVLLVHKPDGIRDNGNSKFR